MSALQKDDCFRQAWNRPSKCSYGYAPTGKTFTKSEQHSSYGSAEHKPSSKKGKSVSARVI